MSPNLDPNPTNCPKNIMTVTSKLVISYQSMVSGIQVKHTDYHFHLFVQRGSTIMLWISFKLWNSHELCKVFSDFKKQKKIK